jgi:Uma2 family endonuclease
MPARRSGQRFTWTDYQSWPDDERWELIGGEAFAMSPAPTTGHQDIALSIAFALKAGLPGKTCRPFVSPIDVRLSDTDVVQPDVLVVCQPETIKPSHIEGAPAVVIEVLSPATATRDLRDKKALYEKYGVTEYIVVDPLEHYAMRFLLGGDGLYDKGTVVGGNETLLVHALDDLPIALWEVFGLPDPLSSVSS